MFDVRDHGAIGDGITLETPAIQKAIDAAAKTGGGTVYVPAGKYVEGLYYDTDNGPAEIRRYCDLDATGRNLIKAGMRQLGLGAQAYHLVLKPARTTEDLKTY